MAFIFLLGADNPTYLKESGDKALCGVGLAGAGVGVICVLKGLYDMSFGVNKK
jgi:hypothetical protein